MTVLDRLITNLGKLPGIGRKSAARMAYFLLQADADYVVQLAQQISELQDRIRHCSVCGSYTEEDPCGICSDPRRDRTLICVVEQSQDVEIIDSTHAFSGLFHVLGGVISPIDGVGPDDIRISELMRRIHQGEVREVIIATNPTVEGDTTALFVHRLLKDTGVTVTRLASGLPVGGDLDYVDKRTLSRSLEGRVRFDD